MCAAQAIAIARHANDPLLLAKALKMLGESLCEMGKPADAVPVLLEALENARSANDRNQTSGILTNLGLAQLYGARCGIAYECFEQALDVLPAHAPILRALALWLIKANYYLGLGRSNVDLMRLKPRTRS